MRPQTVAVLALLACRARGAFDETYPVSDVLDHVPRYRSGRGVVVSVGMVDNRWPNCTVPYLLLTQDNCGFAAVQDQYPAACSNPFLTDAALAVARSRIQTAAEEAHAKTQPVGCVFTEKSAGEYSATGGPHILMVSSKPGACHVHHVGYSKRRPNVMSVGRCYDDLPSVKHEIMHVLGLEHEHQSPESLPYVGRCEAGTCKPNDFNCKALSATPYTSQGGGMDFTSIMMYPIGWRSACGLTLTQAGTALASAQGLHSPLDEIGHVGTISDRDGATIVAHYTADGPNTADCDGHHNRVPACPASPLEGQCVSIHIIGDGECDAATDCYEHDGGDCGDKPEEEETLPDTSPLLAAQHSKRKGGGLAAVVIMCVVAGGIVLGGAIYASGWRHTRRAAEDTKPLMRVVY